ncbi:hypothetical protein AYJ57_22450 (plasmid) [Salipiger sp. CCB-MM3]|nr:hypothetical protein AYJ57_22450 [Salipiger sp. CCB-MM3]
MEHAKIGPDDLARLAVLENSVVRNKYLLKLRYDLSRIRNDDRLAEFIELQKRLFEGARMASGADIVLDSSKAGPRAYVLAAGLDPIFLHAYRGAEDVISSWRRPKFEPSTGSPMKKPPIREAALDWVKVEQAAHALSRVAMLRRIDYHAFSSAPRATLHAALDEVLPGLVDSLDWQGEARVRPAATYHSVLGNPDRFNRDDIEIRPQHASDRSRFGTGERFLIRSVGKGLEAIWR